MLDVFVKRYEKNPILAKDDIPYKVETVHNAADTVMCAGTAVIDELVDLCLTSPRSAI